MGFDVPRVEPCWSSVAASHGQQVTLLPPEGGWVVGTTYLSWGQWGGRESAARAVRRAAVSAARAGEVPCFLLPDTDDLEYRDVGFL